MIALYVKSKPDILPAHFGAILVKQVEANFVDHLRLVAVKLA